MTWEDMTLLVFPEDPRILTTLQKFSRSERLGEEVRNHIDSLFVVDDNLERLEVITKDKEASYLIELDSLPDEVITDVNMLASCVEFGILCNSNGSFIVHE